MLLNAKEDVKEKIIVKKGVNENNLPENKNADEKLSTEEYESNEDK